MTHACRIENYQGGFGAKDPPVSRKLRQVLYKNVLKRRVWQGRINH